MAIVPATNANSVGIIKLLFMPSELCNRVISQAPKIVGIPKSSEKKIASVFLIFKIMAVIKVIPDPLQGSKSALYITPTKVVYDTITLATNDGSGSIEYTSKSRFSVGKINAIGVINIGNDYKKVPSVMGIMPTNKSTATAIVENGKIVGVSVKTGGSGYVNPIVFVEGNAKLKAIIDQGRITGIEVVNSGFGYTTPPVVKIAESDVECLINSDDIGVPRNINVINVGGSFHEDNTLRSTFRSNYILSLSNFDPDCFAIGETIVQEINNVEVARARITSFRSGRLSVDRVSGVFREKKLIKGLARNKSATLETIRYTEFSPQIKTYYDNQGYFESDSGKVSDQNQRITDSFYYQDYSYLVKSKTSIDSWRSLIKSTTHPAGFKVFGEVLIESASNASMSDDSKFIVDKFEDFLDKYDKKISKAKEEIQQIINTTNGSESHLTSGPTEPRVFTMQPTSGPRTTMCFHGPAHVRAHKTTCFHGPAYVQTHKPCVFTVQRTSGPTKPCVLADFSTITKSTGSGSVSFET